MPITIKFIIHCIDVKYSFRLVAPRPARSSPQERTCLQGDPPREAMARAPLVGGQNLSQLGRVCRCRFAGPSLDAPAACAKGIAQFIFYTYYQHTAAVSKDGMIAAYRVGP